MKIRLIFLLIIDFIRNRRTFWILKNSLKNIDYSKQEKIHRDEFMKLTSFLSNHTHYLNYGLKGDVENDRKVWRNIPILTKKNIQKKKFTEYYIKNKLKNTKTVYTGGSTTGEPVMFIEDKRSGDFSRAYFYLSFYRCGWDFSQPWIKLWGRPELNKSIRSRLLKYFSYSLQNCTAYNAFDMSDYMFEKIYNQLSKTPHSHIYSYVNAVVEFARFVEKKKLNIKINFILTTGELLSDDNKLYLEKIFKCPVYNGYACTEINSVAYTNPREKKLIINRERVYVEIVGENDEVLENGKIGRVILTDLQKRSFPLIRYDTGDSASILKHTDLNGNIIYCFNNLNGRVSDIIYTTTGKIIHSIVIQFSLTEFFAKINADLLKFQVIQKLDKTLVFKLDITDKLNENQIKKLKKKLEDDIQEEKISIKFTDEFTYSKSGKIKYFIIEEN